MEDEDDYDEFESAYGPNGITATERETWLQEAKVRVQKLLSDLGFDVAEDERSVEQITADAIADWGERAYLRAHSPSAAHRPSDDNLTVNYLRHNLTDYDSLLKRVKETVEEVNTEIWHTVLAREPEFSVDFLDASLFDDLLNEVNQQVRDGIHEALSEAYPEFKVAIAGQELSTHRLYDGKPFHVGRGRY